MKAGCSRAGIPLRKERNVTKKVRGSEMGIRRMAQDEGGTYERRNELAVGRVQPTT